MGAPSVLSSPLSKGAGHPALGGIPLVHPAGLQGRRGRSVSPWRSWNCWEIRGWGERGRSLHFPSLNTYRASAARAQVTCRWPSVPSPVEGARFQEQGAVRTRSPPRRSHPWTVLSHDARTRGLPGTEELFGVLLMGPGKEGGREMHCSLTVSSDTVRLPNDVKAALAVSF